MSKSWILPLKLFLITLVAGLLLGVTYILTEEPIAQQRALQAEISRSEALPGAKFELVEPEVWQAYQSEDPSDPQIKEIYKATRNDADAGYVITVISKGYGGDMELVIGMGIDQHLTGVTIGTHNETAGLGANATKASFRDQFRGKLNPILAKSSPAQDQEVSALTGATITSSAVVDGVRYGMDIIRQIMEANQ